MQKHYLVNTVVNWYIFWTNSVHIFDMKLVEGKIKQTNKHSERNDKRLAGFRRSPLKRGA